MRPFLKRLGSRSKAPEAVATISFHPGSAQEILSSLPPGLAAEIDRLLALVPIDFGGGCSAYKAKLIAGIIVSGKLSRALEIGVYRGRSLLPMAAAFHWLGSGAAVGVDPYSSIEAEQTDDHGLGVDLVDWAHTQDWEALYQGVASMLRDQGLSQVCELVREPSEVAVRQLAPRSLDLVHIDGNHDQAAVMADYRSYLPLLRPGGFVVLDDVSWKSVQLVYDDLSATGRHIAETRSNLDDFAIFQLSGDVPRD